MAEILPSKQSEAAYILQKKAELEQGLQEAIDLEISLELDLIVARGTRRGFDVELQAIQPEVDRINRDIAAEEKFGPAVEELKQELSPGGKRVKPPIVIG